MHGGYLNLWPKKTRFFSCKALFKYFKPLKMTETGFMKITGSGKELKITEIGFKVLKMRSIGLMKIK